MSASVPDRCPSPDFNGFYAGNTVVAGPLETSAIAAMWAMGRGSQIIPFFAPNVSITTSRTFRFKIRPRYQACKLIWVVGAAWTYNSADAPATITISSTTSSGGSSSTNSFFLSPITTDSVILPTIMHEHDLAAAATAEEDATLTITAVTGTPIIYSIACFEVPRSELAYNTSDGGVDLVSVRFREPIYDATALSLGGLADTVITSFSASRRTGLLQWAVGSTDSHAVSQTGNTTANAFFRDGPQFLARKLYSSSTTGTITIRVYARYSGTGTSNVTFTPLSGGTPAVINFTNNASYAWASAATTVVDCEDLTVVDGRRSTRWDEVDITWQNGNAAGTFYVGAISIYEDTP